MKCFTRGIKKHFSEETTQTNILIHHNTGLERKDSSNSSTGQNEWSTPVCQSDLWNMGHKSNKQSVSLLQFLDLKLLLWPQLINNAFLFFKGRPLVMMISVSLHSVVWADRL